MYFPDLRARAAEFGARLDTIKTEHTDPPWWGWYPFKMLPAFVEHLDALLTGEHRRLLEDPFDRRVADIGGADGDLAFFLESIGFDVDLFEGGPDAVRSLRVLPGKLLKEALNSSVNIFEIDLDHDFRLPREYHLAFLLGTLYHLRNPFLTLEAVSRCSRFCILSTKVARYVPVKGRFLRHNQYDISRVPVAYLLDAYEVNRADPTNYWVFSEACLRRILQRAGWTVLEYLVLGNPDAQPASEHEARAWCLLKSENFEGPRQP
jgi:hypothetical protein